MKISIAWVFDHIKADWKKQNISELASKFNTITAEIEKIEKINFKLQNYFLAKVEHTSYDHILLFCPETNSNIKLPLRTDIQLNDILLVKKTNKNLFAWATFRDFYCDKDGLLPPFYCKEDLISGKWKKDLEQEDYILEVDNKSLTHRPDMWGHRGFAREIAAILNLELKPIEDFLFKSEIKNYEKTFMGSKEFPFNLKIDDTKACGKFAGLFINEIKNRASSLHIATRLLRTNNKTLDALIDLTNYTMLDISQPIHAFDAGTIKRGNILIRFAKNNETIKLLDKKNIKLTNKDLIVTENNKPIALAGIMGGKNSGISKDSKQILLESANFNASTIRKTALNHRIRTESSARFEKSLDPNQNIKGILRFLKLLNDEEIKYNSPNKIISLGKSFKPSKIKISNDFIEKKIGSKIDFKFIVKILEKLEFKIELNEENNILEYIITPPSFRGFKDIKMPEDIVEEIARFYGFSNIKFILPKKATEPIDIKKVIKIRNIKQMMAFSLNMNEVQNYSFFDEKFLNILKYKPKNTVGIKNPVSENWKYLVTSLIPNLLKNIDINLNFQDRLNFFEWGRIWTKENNKILEKKSLGGIFFSKKNNIEFYDIKAKLSDLFNLLKLHAKWKKINPKEPWYNKNHTAVLLYYDQVIGTAGKINFEFLNRISEGDAFIFEIDGDFLLNHQTKIKLFKPLPKYPSVYLDISILTKLSTTVEQLIKEIINADNKIYKAELLDIFEKEEWLNKKSITFRFYMRDNNKTLNKKEIDEIWNNVIRSINKLGASVR